MGFRGTRNSGVRITAQSLLLLAFSFTEPRMYTTLSTPQLSGSNIQIINTHDSSLRIYQVWKGRNTFCLNGRLVFGPDVRSIFLTVSLIVIPVILFCAFISPRLYVDFKQNIGNVIVALCVIFTIYDIALLFLTAGRDPGIIPRNLHPPEVEDEDYASSVSSDRPGSHIFHIKDVIVNGMVVKVKYCQTCMLYRPPRCSHCSICDNCVEHFDHHCPWVGQCIGKRNYRFFFMFVSSTTLLCLYVFAFCWVNVKKIMDAYHCNLWRALQKSPVSAILIFYTFVAAWFVGGLTTFHIYLICTNQTTYENFRYRYDVKTNPYNIGCANNITETLFSKIPKSKNNFRAKVEGNSPSVSHRSLSLGDSLSSEMPKTNINIETGKRRAVAAVDCEEIQSQIDTISFGGSERCQTEPPRLANWGHKTNWGVTPDIEMLTTDFGMKYKPADVEHSWRHST